jgi:phage I-like protein
MKRKEKEDELPPELKDKTAEEVIQALKDSTDTKKKLETLEAERAKEREQVTVLSSEFDKVKARLMTAEANLNKRDNPPRQEEPADWNLEPEKAFKQAVQPLVDITVQNSSMSARLLAIQNLDNEDTVSPTDAKTMNGRLFRVWEGEINEEAKKYPASSMMQPQAWLGIYYLVKGRHADELANPETRKKKYNFVESASQPVVRQEEKKKDGVESLTDQEKHVADKMGVSYENYAKRKKSMQFIGG